MAISQTKYINIISAVAGEPAVSQRELIGRVFTLNVAVPVGQVIEFGGGATNALAAVGEYFGTTSEEYAFASRYFSFVSKKGTQPSKISFANAAFQRKAGIIGTPNVALTTLKSITNGELEFTVNDETVSVSDINLSGATSLQDVADIIDGAVSVANSNLGCSFSTAANNRFVLNWNETESGIEFGFATGDVAEILGWTSLTGLISQGLDSGSRTYVDVLNDSVDLSNNFFSFTFVNAYPLSASDVAVIGQWVATQNVRYLFSCGCTPAQASAFATAANGLDGVALTVDKFNETAQFMPMAAIAAINYNQANAGINLMYQQFAGVQPSVSTSADAALYDGLKINYYGATQQAGQQVAFYQDGVLQGEISDMGVFANEAWLKDAIFTGLLNLRLSVDSLPANDVGLAMVLSTIVQIVNQGLYNGTILPGKSLTEQQKVAITQITGDSDAWQDVQSNGYRISAELDTYVENGVAKTQVSYLLVYGKGDSINYVDGRDILI